MLNLGTSILINRTCDDLDKCVRQALLDTSRALLEAYGITGVDLATGVTTKTNIGGGFSKLVELGVLKTEKVLGEDYIQNAWDTYLAGQRGQSISIKQFVDFTRSDSNPVLEYKRTYAKNLKTGIGLFLVSLHCKKAITLPITFPWPTNRASGVTDRASEIVCAESELLAFVRSICTNRSKEQDRAFAAIGYRQKRIEWYASYATRLLLATGWHLPEDVNLKDLIALRDAEERDPKLISVQAVHMTFLDSVSRKFGDRCPFTADDWVYNFKKRKGGRQDTIGNTVTAIKSIYDSAGASSGLDREILAQVIELKPSVAYPERLKALGAIAGLLMFT